MCNFAAEFQAEDLLKRKVVLTGKGHVISWRTKSCAFLAELGLVPCCGLSHVLTGMMLCLLALARRSLCQFNWFFL